MKKRIIESVLIVALIATCLLAFAACDKDETPTEFEMPMGSRPNKESLISSDVQAIIDKGIVESAKDDDDESKDQDAIKAAVMALYNTANRSRIDTPISLVVQESMANSKMLSSALILMHAFNLRVDTDKFYYQLATQVDAGNAAFNQLFSIWAGYLKVGYSTGEDADGDGKSDYYYFGQIGPQFKCDCSLTTFPYATFVFPDDVTPFENSMTPEEFNEELNVLESIFEINNMKFRQEILADNAKITFENNLYKVEFSVDMDSDPEYIQEWFAMPKKDMAVGGQELKKYVYYNATLEVWDNGYAKYYESSADRDAGNGSGKPVDKYSYIWNDDEIVELISTSENIKDYNSGLTQKDRINSAEECLSFYTSHENFDYVKKELNSLEITGIVIGCLVAVVIAIVVTIEVLVKKGKLPKLAAKREKKKQKRLEKKAAKQEKKIQLIDSETDDGEEDKSEADNDKEE